MTRSRRWRQPDPDLFAVPEIVNPLEVAEEPDPAPEQPGVCGRSRDETVDAEVDERGFLLSLRIPGDLLRGAHPDRLCRAVVEAVANARREAGRLTRERARARIDLAHRRRARRGDDRAGQDAAVRHG